MDGLCNPDLVNYVVGIPYSEMINAGSLVWLLARLESGGCWPFPSLKREGCDVGSFWGGVFLVALQVPSHDDDLVRESLR